MKRKRKWETVKTKDQQTIRLKFPFKHFASRWEHLSGDATRNNRIQIPDIDSIKYANPIFLRFSIRSYHVSRFRENVLRFTFSPLPAEKDIDCTEFAYVQFRGKTRNVLAYPSLPHRAWIYVRRINRSDHSFQHVGEIGIGPKKFSTRSNGMGLFANVRILCSLVFQNENSSREYYIFLFCNCDENESYSKKNNIFKILIK